MLELTVFPAGFSDISASPFSVKALCLMEHSGQPYNVKITSDPRKAPKGKLPVLTHGSKVIPDSDQIRDYMEQIFDVDYDAGLTPEQCGYSRSIIRMIEEHLYFVILAYRWQQDDHWPVVKKEFFSAMPFPLGAIISRVARKGVLSQLFGQGMGRHSFDEQMARAEKDVIAMEAILGKKAFLFGDKPTAADFSAAPMLNAAASFPIKGALNEMVTSRPTLVTYIERSKKEFYPL